MTLKEYAYAAIDFVIDLAAEQGIKYRRGDFKIDNIDKNKPNGLNYVMFDNTYKNGIFGPTGIIIALYFDYERVGKKLRMVKEGFYNYKYCRVSEAGVFFHFTFNEIKIHKAKETTEDQSKIADIIRKVQKLLALADQTRNPSESEAIAASMQAQKLLAKYNIEIADVTGERKKESIEQVIADVEIGKKMEIHACKYYSR